MPSFTADTATLNAVVTSASDADRRAAVNAALGDGQLVFELIAVNAMITGTFSGSLWGDAILAVDNVEVLNPTGAGGAVAGTSLKVSNAGGRFVHYPDGAFTFVGAGSSDQVSAGDEIRLCIRYEPATPPPPDDDMVMELSDLIASMEQASPIQPAFGQHINNEPVLRSITHAAVVSYLQAAPAGQDDFDDFVDEVYPWPWAYPATGHNVGIGLRLEFRRVMVSALRSSTNEWVNLPEAALGPNLGWSQNTATGASTKLRNEVGSGNLSFGPTTLDDGVEVWPAAETYRDRALMVDAKAWAVVTQVRVIDDNGDPYNGADGRFALMVGADQNGGRSRGGADKYAAPAQYPRTRADGWNNAWQLVTGGDWQTFGNITMEAFKDDENPHNSYLPPWPQGKSPFALTRQQVIDNPPSWAIDSDGGGGGGGGTCAIAASTTLSGTTLSFTLAIADGACTSYNVWLATISDGALFENVAVNLTFNAGTYSANLSGIPAGTYYIRAICNDGGACDGANISQAVSWAGDSGGGGGGGGGGGNATSMFGGVVDADPNYVVKPRPANAVRDLMVATDPAWLCGKFSTGWHQWTNVKPGGVISPHMRLADWRDSSGADDGGMFVGSVVPARHTYDTGRIARCAAQSNGCPKILPIWMFPKWMISAANIAEVQARGGPENQYGQIFNITRYPSFPYGAHPPQDWEYIREYVRAIYRPVNQLGPGGEPGMGYTSENWPVLELGNEQKFQDRVIDADRAWFASNTAVSTRCFNLMTMREMNEGLRALKQSAPADVKVAPGGYEGDFNGSVGKTLANPNRVYSYFQAQMLTSDNHGGLGIDHTDIVFFHPYMYDYDPERSQTEIDNARAQLIWLASHLGRPEIANIPIHADETGHESRNGVDNVDGTITWLINNQGASSAYATTARNMKRTVLIWAANGSKQNCIGGNHFVDRPYGASLDANHARQTYGAPSEVPTLVAANQWCNQIVGKVMRQAYQLSDGQIVCYFENGLTLQA